MVKVASITFVVTLVLLSFVVTCYLWAASQPGRIVIPAGNTYLGPNDPSKTK